ncbi:MAG: hypothetical protein HY010_11275 [Acidobacteria bacterium]|nr:hypothetical protein [Acidobacteriota bacterium]
MRVRPEWFDVYAAAFLEADQEQIKERVARARKAIVDRIRTLEAGEPAVDREARDLKDALNKLQILVSVANEMSRPPHFGAIAVPRTQARPQVDGAA